MKFILCLVLVVLCLENVSKAQIAKRRPMVYMVPAEGGSDYAKVPGAVQCADSQLSASNLVDVRAKGCTVQDNYCTFAPHEQVGVEIDFTSPKYSRALSIRIENIIDEAPPRVIHEGPIVTSEVQKGYLYTIRISGAFHPNVAGQKIKSRIMITDRDSRFLRLCVEAEGVVREEI